MDYANIFRRYDERLDTDIFILWNRIIYAIFRSYINAKHKTNQYFMILIILNLR